MMNKGGAGNQLGNLSSIGQAFDHQQHHQQSQSGTNSVAASPIQNQVSHLHKAPHLDVCTVLCLPFGICNGELPSLYPAASVTDLSLCKPLSSATWPIKSTHDCAASVAVRDNAIMRLAILMISTIQSQTIPELNYCHEGMIDITHSQTSSESHVVIYCRTEISQPSMTQSSLPWEAPSEPRM